MSDATVQTVTETPEVEIPQPAESIADHAAQFSPEAQRAAADAATEETPAVDAKKPHPSDAQKRERETGKWTEGKRRNNPVARINELTLRSKSAEEKVATLEAEVARLRTQGAPAAQVQQAQQRVETAQTPQAQVVKGDPEPKDNDQKYNGNYLAYLDDRTRWVARQEWASQQKAASEQASARQVMQTWTERVNKAREKYPDFDTVAFSQTNIPQGSPVDAWIMEHEAGADVLHYLQSHPQERDSLLMMPVLKQVENLALLSARLLSNTNGSSGPTRSLAGREKVIVMPPQPPNLVRTEAQRTEHAPPPTDGSLSIAEHGRQFGNRARR